MDYLEKMPQLMLTLHIACCGFEDLVWQDIQVSNNISMHELAQAVLDSLKIKDLSNYTIVSAGEKFTGYEQNGARTSDSKKFTMADLYLGKGDSFWLEAGCHEFNITIVAAAATRATDFSDSPKVISKSSGSLEDAQRLIDLEFPD